MSSLCTNTTYDVIGSFMGLVEQVQPSRFLLTLHPELLSQMSLGWENERPTLEVQLWILLYRAVRLITICNLDHLAAPSRRLT